MFVINFSPNAVIPSAALAQLSLLSWERRTQEGTGGCGFYTNRGSGHPTYTTLCSWGPDVTSFWDPFFFFLPLTGDLSLLITLCLFFFFNLHLLCSTCLLFQPSQVPNPMPSSGLGPSDSQ